MSKVFAVFDEPINCDYCPCFDGEYWKCKYADRYLDEDKEHPDLKPDWCPLRELPNKKENWTFNSYDDGRVDGWNDCIDEILGDQKECENCGRFSKETRSCGKYNDNCMIDGNAYSNWIPNMK